MKFAPQRSSAHSTPGRRKGKTRSRNRKVLGSSPAPRQMGSETRLPVDRTCSIIQGTIAIICVLTVDTLGTVMICATFLLERAIFRIAL